MPVTNLAFGGGTNAIQGYGDRWQVQFGGVWVFGEKWGLDLVSTAGDYIVGSNNFYPATTIPTFCTTYRNRVYLADGSQFNFSDNNNPTGWEQQNPGAGFIRYLSYFGGTDLVYAIAQFQGFLVVIARRSVQIWTVDADPANFALVQEMDNIGSIAPLSVQNRGDLDVIILDDTGFRSLRTTQVSKQAYVDDIGVPIDSFVQADLLLVSAATCVSVVDPATKNCWQYLNGKIYVLAQYPSSKVQAWTTYAPTCSLGTFVPKKFIVFNGQVFCRATIGASDILLQYGGANNNVYDTSQVTVILPWLDMKEPFRSKEYLGIDLALSGQWTAQCSADPVGMTYENVLINYGSPTTPNELTDSTFDMGRVPFMAQGTHVSMILTSSAAAEKATVGEVVFKYKKGQVT